MKKIVMTLILLVSINVMTVNAEEVNLQDNSELISKTEKYYKTVTNIGSSLTKKSNAVNNDSYTIEITKEEFENYNPDLEPKSVTIETTYKKMTTSIYAKDSYYRYQVELNWKNMPSTRSYDTIGIGFPSSVKYQGTPIFLEKYCTSSSSCYETTGYSFLFKSTNGVGVTFQIPTGTITSMSQKLSFNVAKNTNETIIRQYAYGDYAHATKKISLEKAKKFQVNCAGIVFADDAISYYDEISTARASWTGTW